LIFSILFVIILGSCFDVEPWGNIVFSIIYNAVWMLMELLVSSFFMIFNIDIRTFDYAGSLICEILLLILVKALKMFFGKVYIGVLSWKHNAVIMMIPIFCMIISAHLFYMCTLSESVYNRIFVILEFLMFIVLDVFLFKLYIKIYDSYEIKRNNDIYKMELEMCSRHLKEKETAIEDARKARHDFKYKLLCLRDYSRNKEYDRLNSYIDELLHVDTNDSYAYVDTGNHLLDTLLNYKYETAKKHGIDVQLVTDVPRNMPFDNSDLCVILGNAIDNAIEANQLIEKVDVPNGIHNNVHNGIYNDIQNNIHNDTHKYINIIIKYREKNLIILIENSFSGNIKQNKQGKFVSSKVDKINHGIGLSSIEHALKKYHGYMDINADKKIFTLKMILYSPEPPV
jgi:hypothetical protein